MRISLFLLPFETGTRFWAPLGRLLSNKSWKKRISPTLTPRGFPQPPKRRNFPQNSAGNGERGRRGNPTPRSRPSSHKCPQFPDKFPGNLFPVPSFLFPTSSFNPQLFPERFLGFSPRISPVYSYFRPQMSPVYADFLPNFPFLS